MTLPRPPAAVIFDMDGVLFDRERLYEEATLAAAAELGIDMSSAFFRRTVGSQWPVIRTMLLEHYGETLAVEELHATARRIFSELIEVRLLVKPGVMELVELLDELELPREIATSSTRTTVDRHLATHKLVGRFHRIVAHGDYARGKPDPAPYLKAAQGLAVSPELCLAIEDSHQASVQPPLPAR